MWDVRAQPFLMLPTENWQTAEVIREERYDNATGDNNELNDTSMRVISNPSGGRFATWETYSMMKNPRRGNKTQRGSLGLLHCLGE